MQVTLQIVNYAMDVSAVAVRGRLSLSLSALGALPERPRAAAAALLPKCGGCGGLRAGVAALDPTGRHVGVWVAGACVTWAPAARADAII